MTTDTVRWNTRREIEEGDLANNDVIKSLCSQ